MHRQDLEEESGNRRIDCPVLVTERLVLRLPHVEDMDAIADLANNRRISEMLSTMPYPYTKKHAADFIVQAATGEIGHCVYAITLAETGAFIGCCDIHGRRAGAGYEIGYWLGQPFWAKGYATEAIRALIDTAFRATNIDALYASCFVTNAASRHVLEKAGFNPHCNIVASSQVAGNVEAQEFVLVRHDWIACFVSQTAEAPAASAARNK